MPRRHAPCARRQRAAHHPRRRGLRLNPDPPLHARRRLLVLLAGGAVVLLAVALGRLPAAAEWYGRTLGAAFALGLSRLTGVVPFSLAELVIAAFVLRQLIGAARGGMAAKRGRRRWRNALAAGALRLGQDVGIAVGLFYLLWGLHYARPEMEDRLAWPSGADAPAEVIDGLCVEMIAAANTAYRELHGTDDAGEPTARPADAARAVALEAALEEGWRRAAGELDLADHVERRRGRAKRLLASPLLDRLGLSGFYFPWTGEANVNGGVPAVSLPQVLAHEKAHQRGIAPEDEANFFGFLAAALAPDPLARYSALVFAQRQLLITVARTDRERAQELLAERLPGVQRDIDDLHAYWTRYRGRARAVTRAVNDAYLRTHRVEGGIASYGRSVELLVAWARSRGGQLAPGPLPADSR